MSATTSNDDAEVVEMIACDDCGNMVPESNMAIHRVRACRGRARPTSNDDDDDNNNDNNSGNANSTNHNNNDNINSNNDTVNVDVDVIDLSESKISPSAAARTSRSVAASRKRQDDKPSSRQPRRRRRRAQGRLKRDDDDDDENDNEKDNINDAAESNNEDDNMDLEDDNQNQEIVDLLDDDDDDGEWGCPRCTLLNDQSAARCDACGHNNPTITTASASAFGGNNRAYSDGVRPADPVRRERLVGDDDSFIGGSGGGGSPLGLVGGSALMGAMIGAGGAYLRGREVGRGALEGSVAGAVSGMFMNEFMRTPTRPSRAAPTHTTTSRASHAMNAYHDENNNDSLSQARSASANGQPAYPVMGGGSNRRSTRQPRPSFRVATIPSPNGYTTTVVSSAGRDGSTRVVRRSHHAERDPLFSLMMHTLLAERGGAGRFGGDPEGIDRMSYEQLLSAFGDGTENMGASNGAISSLPTSIVKTKDDGTIDLPTDACQCSVCLEDFEAGQERKILPCLHGFHSGCVNKWLKTNGACPVCKHRITS